MNSTFQPDVQTLLDKINNLNNFIIEEKKAVLKNKKVAEKYQKEIEELFDVLDQLKLAAIAKISEPVDLEQFAHNELIQSMIQSAFNLSKENEKDKIQQALMGSHLIYLQVYEASVDLTHVMFRNLNWTHTIIDKNDMVFLKETLESFNAVNADPKNEDESKKLFSNIEKISEKIKDPNYPNGKKWEKLAVGLFVGGMIILIPVTIAAAVFTGGAAAVLVGLVVAAAIALTSAGILDDVKDSEKLIGKKQTKLHTHLTTFKQAREKETKDNPSATTPKKEK